MSALAYEEMTGLQKSAVLCLALGPEGASRITQKLGEDEVEALMIEIARIDRVEPDLADRVLREALDSAGAPTSVRPGGVGFARELLEKTFGASKAQSVVKRVASHRPDQAGFSRLRKADPQRLATMLRNEHPQTLALILANLPPQQTAAVLKELDRGLCAEIAYRIARMERVSPDSLQVIEQSLGADPDIDLNPGMSRQGGPGTIATILNLLQGTIEKEILEQVAERDQTLSEQIRNLMFVFEDLLRLDDKALQRLLRDVDTKTLALALKGASAELKAKLMAQMSQRAVGVLKEEMEMLGPVRMKDVEQAQMGIVQQVRALEEAGEIVLGGAGDDVVVQ
ncbi:MAG: flagellar motor switch protein FliG [Gemmatimonadetes bacterium]|nr:flagellar motor switch protein FliG [Gemmatimonadota bacterium]